MFFTVSCGNSNTKDSEDNLIQSMGERDIEEIDIEEVPEDTHTYTYQSENSDNSIEVQFSYLNDYWAKYDYSNAAFSSMKEYEEAVIKYMGEIEALFGQTDWWKKYDEAADTVNIQLQLAGDISYSYTERPTRTKKGVLHCKISLQREGFEEGYCPLVHELTHLMLTDYSGMLSLEEGICEYSQWKIEQNFSFLDYGSDVNEYLLWNEQYINTECGSDRQAEIVNMKEIIGQSGAVYPFDRESSEEKEQRNLRLWYGYSFSFARFLVDKFGEESIAEILQNGTDNTAYMTYLNVEYPELKNEWEDYLATYKLKFSSADEYATDWGSY